MSPDGSMSGVSGREALLVNPDAEELVVDVHEGEDIELVVLNEQLLATRFKCVFREENNESVRIFCISLLFSSRNASLSFRRCLTSPNRFGHSSVKSP